MRANSRGRGVSSFLIQAALQLSSLINSSAAQNIHFCFSVVKTRESLLHLLLTGEEESCKGFISRVSSPNYEKSDFLDYVEWYLAIQIVLVLFVQVLRYQWLTFMLQYSGDKLRLSVVAC